MGTGLVYAKMSWTGRLPSNERPIDLNEARSTQSGPERGVIGSVAAEGNKPGRFGGSVAGGFSRLSALEILVEAGLLSEIK